MAQVDRFDVSSPSANFMPMMTWYSGNARWNMYFNEATQKLVIEKYVGDTKTYGRTI